MFMSRPVEPLTINTKSSANAKAGTFAAAAFQYTEEQPASKSRQRSSSLRSGGASFQSPGKKSPRSSGGMNGYIASPDPPPPMYVRALYNYEADDHTSLSFSQGDVIQVLTQLESGWWDGVINNVRGWFPSNYCAVISDLDDPGELNTPGPSAEDISEDSATEEEYEDEQDDDVDSEGNPRDEQSLLPIKGVETKEQEEAAFWIPQATPDGRLFYFNTLTGVSTMELPLETPTSANETGPRDRTNIHIPDQTRPPPEMMAGGFERDEDDYDGSASEAEGESLMLASQSSLPRKRRSLISDGVSPATSMDSMNTSPISKSAKELSSGSTFGAVQQASNTLPSIGTTSTSFATNPASQLAPSNIPRYFFDDGNTVSVTWSRLVDDMRQSVDVYRQAINNGDRASFVKRAEDISDHLRMLLAAGSGTTDNHSGNPSIISTNKALYPHFRDMMSRFSKLVLSSHIAAADWSATDSRTKCLHEADGVMHGVYGYVEVARQQRGDDVPRLVPGFVLGSTNGGGWQNNNLSFRDPTKSTSFMDQDEYEPYVEVNSILDTKLLKRLDDLKRIIASSMRRLDEQLIITEKVITPSQQKLIGDAVCSAAGKVIEMFRAWVSTVESVNLAPLGSSFQNPQLVEFSSQKQKLYDYVADLLMSCQAVAAPLGDEWAEVRGESLEDRLNQVRVVSKQLETCIQQIGFLLQLLLESMPNNGPPMPSKADHRLTDGGETYQRTHLRADSRPQIGDTLGHSTSYTIGDAPPEKYRRPNKVDRFFGQVPPADITIPRDTAARDTPPAIEEVPWYLKLDHEGEVFYDTKFDPPQIKSGSLTGLVEQLTRHDRLDAPFNSTFLLTYRSFTTAGELFERLVRRFNIQPPAGLYKEDYQTWEDQKQQPIRFRVVNILKSWFENYWMESNDEASMKLLGQVYAFAKDFIANTKTPGSAPLMAVVDQRIKGQDPNAKRLVLTVNSSVPTPIMPKNMKKLKFLDIDATEFARQLTIIESRLYGKIKPTECLNKTWQRKVAPDDPEPAANVKALILHSNQLTNWVAEMILTQSDVKKRVVVIKHFVSVAEVGLTLFLRYENSC
jgi:son of sevenless-like protein